VSPIEYGHVLLIPRIFECLPQRIDHASFLLALEMAVEAGNPYFRLGYNSLGAFATINHLHFQVLASQWSTWDGCNILHVDVWFVLFYLLSTVLAVFIILTFCDFDKFRHITWLCLFPLRRPLSRKLPN